MRPVSYFFIFVLALTVTSCETTFYDEIERGAAADYFPFREGQYRLYQVDSLRFYPDGPVTVIDTTRGTLREEVRNITYISPSHVHFELWRTYRSQDGGSDPVTRIWQAEIEDGRWFQNEENLRFFLIDFDARVNDRWSSLLFNPAYVVERVGQSPILPYIEWRSRLVSQEEELVLDNFTFHEVLQLERAALTNSLLELRTCNEWYVRGTGLVKSERWILDSQCIECPQADWLGKAEVGYMVRQELMEYN